MDHDPANFAATFPILNELTFLNHAAVAPISGPAADALRWYAGQAESAAYCHADWYARVETARRAAATLLNARGPHEIAFVPNTSAGLGLVARGLDWRLNDDVVITNVEYPANRYPWQDLKRLGVNLIEVPQLPDGGSCELQGAQAVGMTTVMMVGVIKDVWADKIEQRRIHADFGIGHLLEFVRDLPKLNHRLEHNEEERAAQP